MALPFYASGRLADLTTGMISDREQEAREAAAYESYLASLARDAGSRQLGMASLATQEAIADNQYRLGRELSAAQERMAAGDRSLRQTLGLGNIGTMERELEFRRADALNKDQLAREQMKKQIEYGELVGKYGGFSGNNAKLRELYAMEDIDDSKKSAAAAALIGPLNQDVQQEAIDLYDKSWGLFGYGANPRFGFYPDQWAGQETYQLLNADPKTLSGIQRARIARFKNEFIPKAQAKVIAARTATNPELTDLMRFMEFDASTGQYRHKPYARARAARPGEFTPYPAASGKPGSAPAGGSHFGFDPRYGVYPMATNPPSSAVSTNLATPTNNVARLEFPSYFNPGFGSARAEELPVSTNLPAPPASWPETAPSYKGPVITDGSSSLLDLSPFPVAAPAASTPFISDWNRQRFNEAYGTPESQELVRSNRLRDIDRILNNPIAAPSAPYRGYVAPPAGPPESPEYWETGPGSRGYDASLYRPSGRSTTPAYLETHADFPSVGWVSPGFPEPILQPTPVTRTREITISGPARRVARPAQVPTPPARPTRFFQTVNDELIPYDDTAPTGPIPLGPYTPPEVTYSPYPPSIPVPINDLPAPRVTARMSGLRPVTGESPRYESPRGRANRGVLMRRTR